MVGNRVGVGGWVDGDEAAWRVSIRTGNRSSVQYAMVTRRTEEKRRRRLVK
jgi:hypothetical protein